MRARTRLIYALPLLGLLAGITTAEPAAGAGNEGASSRPQHFSMDVWMRPMREVSTDLARLGSVDILMPDAVGRMEVSASLVDVDVRTALQRLLQHHSYMLIERRVERSGERGHSMIEIVLFGAGAAGRRPDAAAPLRVTASGDRSVDELVQDALAATSGSERADAVDAIAYLDTQALEPASRAEAVLLGALSDPDDAVRSQAITTLKDTAEQIPFDALSQVAREDERAAIRIQALELLVERGAERALGPVRVALLDSEDAVRTRARELIEEWHLDAGAAGSL